MKEQIEFLNWVFENHFRLVDIIAGVHIYKSESFEEKAFTSKDLYLLYLKEKC